METLRHAARSLRRSPAFVCMVVGVLGIGVALNTAIFTVVDSVLLRPLPFRNADRIASLQTHLEEKHRVIDRLGGDDYNDAAAQLKGAEAAAWYQSGEYGVQAGGRSLYLRAATVSPRFAEVMGVAPVAGRLFNGTDQDGTEALVSASFAHEQFGFVEAALGQPLRTIDSVRTVVGVLPDGFSFPDRSALWLEGPARPRTASRTSYSQRAVVLRREGVTAEQLNAQLAVLSQQLKRAYVDDRYKSLGSVPLQETVVGSVRPTLRLLMGSVAVLLLIVCANITHLQLVRATRRARLVTIQTALGASRTRIALDALAEALLLGLGGGALALLLAVPALRLFVHLAPANVPRLADVHINAEVFAFSLVLSVLLMGLTAVLPVWRSWHLAPAAALRQDSSRGLEDRGVRRLRGSFVIAEVALTLTLCVGAVLLARQLRHEAEQDFGFAPENLITLDAHMVETLPPAALMHAETPAQKAEQEAARRASEQRALTKLGAALDDVRSIVGVTSAEAITGAPMGFDGPDVGYAIRGKQVFAPPYRNLPNAEIRPVTPDLLHSMKVPLLAGRWLSPDDRRDTSPVLLVSASLARQHFPGESAVGKQIMCGFDDVMSWWTIVGVVGDTRNTPGAEPSHTFYVPVAQHGDAALEMQMVVRTRDASVTPDALAMQLRQHHPEIAIKGSTLAENVDRLQQPALFRGLLFGGFATVSILLAAAGMYGVMAYSVAQRSFEFGLRFALGAQRIEVLGMVLRQAALLCGTGLALGLALSAALLRVFASVIGRPPAFDAAAYGAAVLAVLTLTMLATAVPANRAANVHPNEVLRGEV